MPEVPTGTLMAIGGAGSTHYFYVPQKPQTLEDGSRVVYSRANFQTIQSDSNFNWVAQQRLSRDPAMQFTGPGEETLTIEGVLYPHLFGGFPTIQGLMESGRRGDIMKLIMYSPTNDGMIGDIFPDSLVIRRVKRTHTKFLSNGKAAKIEFSLEMVRYGDDGVSQTRFISDENDLSGGQ